MKKHDLYAAIFWVALGVFVSAYAYIKLGIGKFNAPGPGFMPFLLGVLFTLFALFAAVRILRQTNQQERSKAEKSDQPETAYKKVILVIVVMYIYALLLEPLGFLFATFLAMTFLFRSAGFKRWIIAAAYSGVVVLVTYFLFTYLGVRFPPGVLRAVGLN
jgi:uncharacterized membrane protein